MNKDELKKWLDQEYQNAKIQCLKYVDTDHDSYLYWDGQCVAFMGVILKINGLYDKKIHGKS